MRTATDWTAILTRLGVKPATAARWADAFAAEVQADKFSLGESEIADFISQVLHESGMLEIVAENLNYSRPGRLCEVWPKRFPTESSAIPYVRNAQALANKLYGGRLGNTGPNDGWLYRGSGPIQVTGKENFIALERITGLPLVEHPELLRQPGREALHVCITWWEGHVPDAVMGNVVRVRRSVNGGTIGLDETTRLYALAKRVLA